MLASLRKIPSGTTSLDNFANERLHENAWSRIMDRFTACMASHSITIQASNTQTANRRNGSDPENL
jgi:hypothetical protein